MVNTLSRMTYTTNAKQLRDVCFMVRTHTYDNALLHSEVKKVNIQNPYEMQNAKNEVIERFLATLNATKESESELLKHLFVEYERATRHHISKDIKMLCQFNFEKYIPILLI